MKKDIRIHVWNDGSVGIKLERDYMKPTRKMRKALSKFLKSDLIAFCGYSYSLGIIPKEFILIKEIKHSFGVEKIYNGTLVY